MTIGGWITMCVSMGSFALLFIWCMQKALLSDKSARQKKRQDTQKNKA